MLVNVLWFSTIGTGFAKWINYAGVSPVAGTITEGRVFIRTISTFFNSITDKLLPKG
jgi:hypothetical protein